MKKFFEENKKNEVIYKNGSLHSSIHKYIL